MSFKVTLRGVDDVRRLLGQIAPKEASNLMRATVHDMAGQMAEDARAGMPRDSGAMIASTKAKRERARFGTFRSTVRVERAFYWRFLEYGDGPDGVEHAFFLRAVRKMQATMDSTFLATFARKLIERLGRR